MCIRDRTPIKQETRKFVSIDLETKKEPAKDVYKRQVRTPKEVKKDSLECGEVGWLCASIKSIQDVRVGDTITNVEYPASAPLHGYREMNPMVYCGLYPIDSAKYNDLRDALEKLQLNDASLQFEMCIRDRI